MIDWFPDWTGENVAIVASGPSAKNNKFSILKGKTKVIAIKQSYDLCEFADVVYGCDAPWWRHRNGLPEFKGLKVTWRGNGLGSEFPDIKRIDIQEGTDKILTANPGTVGSGGNSGFQALNLAVQFGAKHILFMGLDMTTMPGVHWYGRNNWNMANNPSDINLRRWIPAMEQAAKDMSAMGIKIATTSPYGVVQGFMRATIE